MLMPAQHRIAKAKDTFLCPALLRAVCSGLAIFAVIFQLLFPVAAQASNSDWIEICAEQGPVMIQVDYSGDEPEPVTGPCPKCQACALCALADVTDPSILSRVDVQVAVGRDDLSKAAQCLIVNPAQYWPDTRGPPVAPQNITERALRASIALIQNIGGALWT
ncbi:hypothetical protein DS909_03555 [Phaeobacter gallaeciensis]|uniref:DUF2946 domain-containing protein n=2 Tax=Roseobacteraceae TaxID=2854170 RepID=A0A366X5W9_9RHOB|nr:MULTISPECIES: DUF2946 family protein [Roseobacteraceae]MBT3142496.1 hypothetical protein [Falsiruegeria litorea]MBT8169276.1 hypothetical protein [Falsiruegeria litorea]RBW60513.1 hypothetical protein DS909_03555 [Phaeobacter gallaeciensis]